VVTDLPQRDAEDEGAGYGRLRGIFTQDSVNVCVDDCVCFTPHGVAVIVVL